MIDNDMNLVWGINEKEHVYWHLIKCLNGQKC